MSDSPTFVFEVCTNCGSHQWNTRHDEAKYAQFFADVAAHIKELVPNANCVMNRVPKPWYEKEIYCQLIPNEDDNNPYYDILPRIGAFEVSTVHDNVDILLYSKMMSTMWPHAPSLASRVASCVEEMRSMPASQLREKYQTSGRQVRQARAPRDRDAQFPAERPAVIKSFYQQEAPVQQQEQPVQQETVQEPEPVREPEPTPAQEDVKQAEPETAAAQEPEPAAPVEQAPAQEEAKAEEAEPSAPESQPAEQNETAPAEGNAQETPAAEQQDQNNTAEQQEAA